MVWENDPGSMKCPRGSASIDFTWSAKGPPGENEKDGVRAKVKDGGRGHVFIFGQGGWDNFEVEPARRWVSAMEGVLGEIVSGYERPEPVPEAKEEEEEEVPVMGVTGPVGTTWGQKDAAVAVPGLTGVEVPKAGVIPRYAKGKKEADWRDEWVDRGVSRDLPPRLWVSPNAQGLRKLAFFTVEQNNIKLMNFEREMRAWVETRGFDSLGLFNLTVQSLSLDGTHASMESNLVKAMMVFNWLDSVGQAAEAQT